VTGQNQKSHNKFSILKAKNQIDVGMETFFRRRSTLLGARILRVTEARSGINRHTTSYNQVNGFLLLTTTWHMLSRQNTHDEICIATAITTTPTLIAPARSPSMPAICFFPHVPPPVQTADD
jgi:hypothetical protein